MLDRPPAQDIPRITFAVLAILAMAASSLWILAPFAAAIVWATMIVVTTWPILLWLQAHLGGRRGPAVAVMVVVLLAILVVPTWLGISTMAQNAGRVAEIGRALAHDGLPPPPEWVARIPLAGQRLADEWAAAAGDPESLSARVAPYVGDALRWLAAKAGGVGGAIVQFLLTVIICAVMYGSGEAASRGVLRFLRRLGGDRGEAAGRLAGQAIRAVALGVVVTALAQTVVAGVGLWAGGVPHAGAFTAVVLVLCIAQVGPILVMVPATIWAFSNAGAGRGTALLVFTVLAGALDNFLRPVLIKRGADLPLLLIFAGVIGGLLALGIVGLFVGPVVLAVTWTLLSSWVADLDRPAEG